MSRTFKIWELDRDEPTLVSEDEIRDHYYKYWQKQMRNKFGTDDHGYDFEDCIQDWMCVHWAEEVT